MKEYGIQQIDYLRDKAGITYEEAVELLDRFDGDLARCLVELERGGRLKAQGRAQGQSGGGEPSGGGARGDHRRGRPAFVLDFEGVNGILFSHILVRKEERVIANITVLFALFVLLCAPWVAVISIAWAFLSGCRVKWVKNGRAGANGFHGDFHSFADQAAENIRRTADSVAAAVTKRGLEEEPAETAAADGDGFEVR